MQIIVVVISVVKLNCRTIILKFSKRFRNIIIFRIYNHIHIFEMAAVYKRYFCDINSNWPRFFGDCLCLCSDILTHFSWRHEAPPPPCWRQGSWRFRLAKSLMAPFSPVATRNRIDYTAECSPWFSRQSSFIKIVKYAMASIFADLFQSFQSLRSGERQIMIFTSFFYSRT